MSLVKTRLYTRLYEFLCIQNLVFVIDKFIIACEIHAIGYANLNFSWSVCHFIATSSVFCPYYSLFFCHACFHSGEVRCRDKLIN